MSFPLMVNNLHTKRPEQPEAVLDVAVSVQRFQKDSG